MLKDYMKYVLFGPVPRTYSLRIKIFITVDFFLTTLTIRLIQKIYYKYIKN
jgi:hypothetical protein